MKSDEQFLCDYCDETFHEKEVEQHLLKCHSDGKYLCYIVKLEEFICNERVRVSFLSIPGGTTLATIEKYLDEMFPNSNLYMGQFYYKAEITLPWNTSKIVDTREYVLNKGKHIGDDLPNTVFKYDYWVEGDKPHKSQKITFVFTRLGQISRKWLRPAVDMMAENENYDSPVKLVYDDNGGLLHVDIDEDSDNLELSGMPGLLREVVQIGDLKMKTDVLGMYLIAAARIYGVISFKEFRKLIQTYAQTDIDPKLFLDIIKSSSNFCSRKNVNGESVACYGMIDHMIVKRDISDFIKDIIDVRKNKPMHILPEEEFIKFCNPLYYMHTPSIDAFRNFFAQDDRYLRYGSQSVEGFVLKFTLMAQLAYFDHKRLTDFVSVDELDGSPLWDTIEDFKAAIEVTYPAFNDTPLWGNYGWAPAELSKNSNRDHKGPLKIFSDSVKIRHPENDSLSDQNHDPEYPKVGRNEPCPCGSGKKYKHCHGKVK